MTPLPVHRKRRRNSTPWRWLALSCNFLPTDSKIADLIEFNRLKTRIGNRQRIARHRIANPEMVFWREHLPLRRREIPGLQFRYCRVALMRNPDMYGYADRKSGSIGSSAVPKSIHPSMGFWQLHAQREGQAAQFSNLYS